MFYGKIMHVIEYFHSHVDYIFCREKIIGKTGEMSKDNLEIYLNSLLNYD